MVPIAEAKGVLVPGRPRGSSLMSRGGVPRALCSLPARCMRGDSQDSRATSGCGRRRPGAATIPGYLPCVPTRPQPLDFHGQPSTSCWRVGPGEGRAVYIAVKRSGSSWSQGISCRSVCDIRWVKRVVVFLKMLQLRPSDRCLRRPDPHPLLSPPTQRGCSAKMGETFLGGTWPCVRTALETRCFSTRRSSS